MRKLMPVLLVAVISLIALPARSQDAPQWEFFGGYDFTHVASGNESVAAYAYGTFPTSPVTITLPQSLNGWHGSISENVNSWFGGVADFTGAYGSTTLNYASAGGPEVLTNRSFYTFQGGPEFSYRKIPRLRLFGHGLIGGIYDRTTNASESTPHYAASWSFGFGGGIDVQVSQHLAVRVLQGDWFVSHINESLTSDTQNGNWTASAGLVLRIGQR